MKEIIESQSRRWLYGALIALPVIVIVVYWFFCLEPPLTVLLIRHADRQGSQDKLSNAGEARAQELVHVLEKSGVNAIYHSNAIRTEKTAAPLAMAIGITPAAIAAADTTLLVNDIRTQHSSHTVLVVGHSDTVPEIITALGGPSIPNIAGNEFDNLFVLTTCHCTWPRTKLVKLQYGAASP